MAGSREVRKYAPTCPPGTPIEAPIVIDLVMPARTILETRIRIPPGPLGSMGWQIGSAGQPFIPINDNSFIVGDDEILTFPQDDIINSGALQAIMYNLGSYSHTIYVTFLCELPNLPAGVAGADLIPAESLGSLLPASVSPTDATSLSELDSES